MAATRPLACLGGGRAASGMLCAQHAGARLGLQNSDRHTRHASYSSRQRRRPRAPPSERDRLDSYFDDLVSHPNPQPATATAPTPPPMESLPRTEDEQKLKRARVVFGSRLAGPGDRGRDIRAASKLIAGVMVPPRPQEPDNCCMSGCVNCVWDQYRDEIEEWADKSAEANRKLAEQEGKAGGKKRERKEELPTHVAVSMDDDGGGSETNWTLQEVKGRGDDLFEGIPVGIREFMRTEKKLKEKKRRAT